MLELTTNYTRTSFLPFFDPYEIAVLIIEELSPLRNAFILILLALVFFQVE